MEQKDATLMSPGHFTGKDTNNYGFSTHGAAKICYNTDAPLSSDHWCLCMYVGSR